MLKIKNFICEFGFKYTFISGLSSISNKINNRTHISHLLFHYKYTLVTKYLYKKNRNLINKWQKKEKNDTSHKKIKDSKYVWICWWQGLNNAPDIVKACVNRIKKRAGNKKVIVITKNNYNKYITLSSYIIDKFEKGVFSFTFLSDLLRMCLLSKWGGIWIDSTVFINENLSKLDNFLFFTIRHGLYSSWHVCKGKWSGFFIGCGPHNFGISLVRDILIEYVKTENILMAYLLVDSAMTVAYDCLSSFRKEVESVPVNNSKVFEMETTLNLPITSAYSIPSHFNKLTYKKKYMLVNKGKETIYSALVNNNI